MLNGHPLKTGDGAAISEENMLRLEGAQGGAEVAAVRSYRNGVRRNEIHILVIFACETGAVEQLALAAAVGAVQARAEHPSTSHVQIRARPVTPVPARLDQDYVAPREADTAWAARFGAGDRWPFYSITGSSGDAWGDGGKAGRYSSLTVSAKGDFRT